MGVRLVKYSKTFSESNSGDANNDHSEMSNRDLQNQHPIYAITGLQEVLNTLEDSIDDTNKLLLQKDKTTNERIDNILLDIEAINKAIEEIRDIINNLNIIKDVQDTDTVDMDYNKDTKILKADVKIYSDDDNTNALQVYSDGLYVPKIATVDTKTVEWTKNKNSDNKPGLNNITASVKISKEADNEILEKDDGIYAPAFVISKESGNSIEKKTDGYYVEGLEISAEPDNVIEKLTDGLYVRDSTNFRKVTQTAHGFTVGDFIYYHPTNKYQLASAIDSYDSNIVGMVIKVIDDNTFEYQWSGFVETKVFSSSQGYTQGMPVYISDTDPGKVVQEQPDISKAVGYPVENVGIIISVERGIQYNQEASIGDFKTSANNYDIRSDGFIRVADGIEYRQTLVERLIDTLDDAFKDNYMTFDDVNSTVSFKNSDALYTLHSVPVGFNLFIKAF